jgi:hypothetical protein
LKQNKNFGIIDTIDTIDAIDTNKPKFELESFYKREIDGFG